MKFLCALIVTVSFFSAAHAQCPMPANTRGGMFDVCFQHSGQGPDDYVSSFLEQPDGKFLIGGRFSIYNGLLAKRLVRVLPNGALDSTFQANLDLFAVRKIGLLPDGKIMVVDQLGFGLEGITRLMPDGSPDTAYHLPPYTTFYDFWPLSNNRILLLGSVFSDPGLFILHPDGTLESSLQLNSQNITSFNITEVAEQPDHKILLAGLFGFNNQIAESRNLIRINPDGALDSTFTPIKSAVAAKHLALQQDGKPIISGDFGDLRFGNQASVLVQGLTRLTPSGTLDTSFHTGTGITAGTAYSLALQTDGKLLISGSFVYNGRVQKGIGRLLVNGNPDVGFNALDEFGSINGADQSAIGLQQLGNGKLVVFGGFKKIHAIPRMGIALLKSNGIVDEAFNPGDGLRIENRLASEFAAIADLAIQPDGRILACGNFTASDLRPQKSVARFWAGGALDTTFHDPEIPFSINTIALQPDQKVLAGGAGLLRLESNGVRDTAFHPSFYYSANQSATLYKIALTNDGKILVAGNFGKCNGVFRSCLAQLNLDGTLDAGFVPATFYQSTEITDFALQPDGKILLSGIFLITGSPIKNIARLNPNGSLDTTFHNRFDDGFHAQSILLQADGKILLGGASGYFHGSRVKSVIRLNADGSPDNSFNSYLTYGGSLVYLQIQPDQKILAALPDNGNSSYGILTRINPDGSKDTSFYANYGFSEINLTGHILTMKFAQDGKLLIGGNFHTYSTYHSDLLARVFSTSGVITGISDPDIPKRELGGKPTLITPNPAENLASLHSIEPLRALTLICMDGRTLVPVIRTEANQSSFSVEGYPPGLYTLIAQTQSGRTLRTRLVVER